VRTVTNNEEIVKQTEIILRPGMGAGHYWLELWRFRELFFFLAWRDILIRYKQTAIGIAWSILRPLLTMIVFTVIFGKLARLPSEGVPYPIMVFTAMLPWQFFANSLTESSNSLVANANMLTKVYFPRMIVPASAILVSFVDFIISCMIMVLLMVWYAFVPGWRIFALPLFLGLAFIASFGFGLWLTALNVKYRDFRYIVPFLVQFGLYVSPVGFSSSIVPEKWRLIYSLNPMVAVIDGFRWAILGGTTTLYLPGIFLSTAVTFVLFLVGVSYFRGVERRLADII
jgi:lipopolysaccharide transport system permease protein